MESKVLRKFILKHEKYSENDISAGKLVTRGSKLKCIISKPDEHMGKEYFFGGRHSIYEKTEC